MKVFFRSLGRELTLHLRGIADVLNPLVFFLVVISLFPLAIGPDASRLSGIAPGIIWVAALLATLMSMDLMFRTDYEDGSLEQMVLSGHSLLVLVLSKVVAHWLVSGLPLVLLMPVVGLVLFMDAGVIQVQALALLLVSPTLSLIGGIGSALTVGLPRAGLLVSILVLPLYTPLLILATTLVQVASTGMAVTGYFYWLAAALILALTLAPIATAASLRVAVDQ